MPCLIRELCEPFALLFQGRSEKIKNPCVFCKPLDLFDRVKLRRLGGCNSLVCRDELGKVFRDVCGDVYELGNDCKPDLRPVLRELFLDVDFLALLDREAIERGELRRDRIDVDSLRFLPRE